MSGAFSERSRRQDDVCMRHRYSMHSMRVMADHDTLHLVLHVFMLMCSILSPVCVRQNIVLFLVIWWYWSGSGRFVRYYRGYYTDSGFSRAAYIVHCPTNRVLPPVAQHDGQNLCRMCTVADLEEGRALSVLNRKRSIGSIYWSYAAAMDAHPCWDMLTWQCKIYRVSRPG